MAKSKRTVKLPSKFKNDDILLEMDEKEAENTQCVVLCYEDSKEYTCKTTSLSTEARDYVSKSDLTPGNQLIWKYKGKNYTVEFKRFKGTAEPSSNSRPQYPEDSESPACTSEEEDEKDVKGKGKRTGPKASLYPQNNENDEVVSVVSKKRLGENEQTDLGRLQKKLKTDPHAKLQEIVKNGFDSLNRTLLSIADILQNQGTGVAASVGGTAPLSGAGALIVDAISQSSHVDGLATCSVSVLGAEGTTVQDEKRFISKGGIELLKIDSTDIVKYGLALLDALFTDEEQATHCYKVSGKSNSSSVSAKPPMSPGRVKTLEECIEKKFGAVAMAASKDKIRTSLNQKCRDKHRKLADQLKRDPN
ncbi:hypothetical protein EMCRGX_G008802 [Ephydatia muelleri]